MPKVELEGYILRRGYADDGAAWLGGGVLLTSRCDGAVVYGHPAERESLRTSAGLHWSQAVAVPGAAAAEGHRACPGEVARFSDQPRMSELPPSLLPQNTKDRSGVSRVR